MTHANAPLTPVGRLRLARLIVDAGWSTRRAAERFQVSPATASKWASRHRAGLALLDGSSRPHRSPNRTPRRLEHRIVSLRFTRQWGPHRIGYHLRVPRSTVEQVLVRYRMPKLSWLDQATGLPVRRQKPIRYEHPAPGDLVHVDIKKQGRIPDGGGHRKFGRKFVPAQLFFKGPRSSTMPSMTTPGSPTPRSSAMRRKTPPPGSGRGRTRSSKITASP